MVRVGCIMILLGYAVLIILSRNMEGTLFERMGARIHFFLRERLKMPVESRVVEKDLGHLFTAMQREKVKEAYYEEKWSLILKIVLAGVSLCLAINVLSSLNGGEITFVSREEVGGGAQELTVEAVVGEESKEIVLLVDERLLHREEQEKLLQECINDLEQGLMTECWKDSKGSWVLPESLEGYPFEIYWRNKGMNELEAYFYYGEEMYRHIFYVSTGGGNAENQLEEQLLQAVQTQNLSTLYEKEYLLPKEVDGVPVTWKTISEDNSGILLAIVILLALSVYFLKDRDLHREWEKKKLYMKVSYPMVLSKFVLYMGAGLPVRGCFQRIAKEGQKSEKGTVDSGIYGEMFYAGQELSAGVSESLVYERFAERTGLEEYARFSTMLTQNVKKGSTVLLERLREECKKAQIENIHIRKKLGEEAQTKLLLPMVMMLAIVMLLVMVPAFYSI